MAVGRKPALDGLQLTAAKIRHDAKGIVTDRRLRTSNRHVYAIGDVAGRQQFTHIAGYHAGIVIRNILFKIPAKLDDRACHGSPIAILSWRMSGLGLMMPRRALAGIG